MIEYIIRNDKIISLHGIRLVEFKKDRVIIYYKGLIETLRFSNKDASSFFTGLSAILGSKKIYITDSRAIYSTQNIRTVICETCAEEYCSMKVTYNGIETVILYKNKTERDNTFEALKSKLMK